MVFAALQVRSPTWAEWLILPVVYLVANAFEWRVHRDLLHHRVKPMQELYDRHTPEHHMIYTTHDMAIRSFREFRYVLIPAVGVGGIVAIDGALAWALGHFWSANAGWLFLATSASYTFGYETSHLSYHLSPKSFIGRRWLVGVLRRHHATHHDPKLMQKWNFNVTIPLWDWVRGTIHRG